MATPPNIDKIPAELAQRRQWVVWREEIRDGKPTKKPYQALNPRHGAKSNDPATWSSFNAAWECYLKHMSGHNGIAPFSGIGYVFSPDDPYVGVDLDKCLKDGEPADWAVPHIHELMKTYGEISPSGTGIKFFAKGKLPDSGKQRTGFGSDGSGRIELYDRLRFFAVTGRQWGDSASIVDLNGSIDALYKLASERPAKSTTDEIKAQHAGRFRRTATNGLDDEDRAIAYLAKIEPAIDGQGGSNVTFRAGIIGHEFGIEKERWLQILIRDYNPRCDGPWTEDELEKKVDDAYRKADKAFGWRASEDNRPQSNGAAHDDETSVNRTDVGNARRLVAAFGDQIRYCQTWRSWLIWDGKRWRKDDRGRIYRLAKKTIGRFAREAFKIQDEEKRKQCLQWALKSEGRKQIESMVELARSEPGVGVTPDDLDQDGWLLNVKNGTVDLHTGQLKPHDPADLITRIAPTTYDPAAKCPLWIKTIERIFEKQDNPDADPLPDQAMIDFIQRLFGYFLTADISEEILPIFYGSGANGKTTILGAMLSLLGEDYAIPAPPDLLVVKHGTSHPTERAVLCGKRLVVDAESAEGARLNEALVKLLTGKDRITGRGMRQDFWSFLPTHKLVMGTNHRPVIRETKNAIWRRVKLVPFNSEIPAAEQIRDLADQLVAEYPGILAWCVRGCLEWQKNGLEVPTSVTLATDEYRRDQDVLGDFIAEECVLEDELWERATPLYEHFAKWADLNGEYPMTKKTFSGALTERGFERFLSNGKCYRGLALRVNIPPE